MSHFANLLRRTACPGRNRGRRPKPGAARRLRLEGLEGREVPAAFVFTLTVTSVSGPPSETVPRVAVARPLAGDTCTSLYGASTGPPHTQMCGSLQVSGFLQ